MEWFVAVVAVAALGVAAMAAAGGVGQMSKDPVHDVYRQDLPDRPLAAADLQTVRFGVTLRGYAMGQVDDLLDRLSREIGERDARLAAQAAELARLTGDSDGQRMIDDDDPDGPPTLESPAVDREPSQETTV